LNKNTQMRINHIVTSRQGGAYIAAKTLHLGLLEHGKDSRLYTRNLNIGEVVNLGEEPGDLSVMSKFRSKTVTALQARCVQKERELITTFGIDVFFQRNAIQSNSIIHIHSIYNFLNSRALKELVEQDHSLILQLHDQRFFTGGCHNDLGCEAFKRDCTKCPQVHSVFHHFVTKEKKIMNWILGQRRVHVVAPSKYLFEKASSVVPENRLHLIPNLTGGMQTAEGFQRVEVRERLKLNPSDFVLGFCAANIDSPYKNFEYFKVLIKEIKKIWIKELPKLKIMLVGNGGEEFHDENLIRFSSANGMEVREHLAAMDLLLVPSKADNVPNVIVEALLEGTPVLATRVGGIPDLLDHLGGDVFLTGDPILDSKIILEYTNFDQRDSIKKKSNLRFDQERVINAYVELYDLVSTKGIA
jgi:glycosyltransferase involved in cell wall biosynthesis